MEKSIKIITLFILVALFSCKASVNNKPKDKSSNIVSKEKEKAPAIKLLEKYKQEQKPIDTLPLKNVKFNGKSFRLKHSEISKNKDSIKQKLWECGNPFGWKGNEFNHIYSKGIEYVTNENEAVLLRASIIDNRELELLINSKKYIINSKTTIQEFKRLFPNSEISDFTDEGKGYLMSVSFNTRVTENSWEFYFNNEKNLIKFSLYWWLC